MKYPGETNRTAERAGDAWARARERRVMLLFALFLSFLGILVQWSISNHRAGGMSLLVWHVVWVGLGIFTALKLCHARIHWLDPRVDAVIFGYSILLFLIYLAQLSGIETERRPTMFGEFNQSYSAALRLGTTRILLPIALAYIFTHKRHAGLSFKRVLFALVLSAMWGAFMVWDFGPGPMIAFVFLTIFMAWLAGLRTTYAMGLIAWGWLSFMSVVVLTDILNWDRLDYYAREAFREVAIHPTYAMASIARGEIFGVGLGNAAPMTFTLPSVEESFIFALLGQELGLFGCLLVLYAFVIILLRGFHIAESATLARAQLGAAGIAMTLFLLAFNHIAYNCNLSPILGPPLPFISAGSPNILFSWAALGVLLSASRTQRRSMSKSVTRSQNPDVQFWKPRRRRAAQLCFILLALLLVFRLTVIVTNLRVQRTADFLFEQDDDHFPPVPSNH